VCDGVFLVGEFKYAIQFFQGAKGVAMSITFSQVMNGEFSIEPRQSLWQPKLDENEMQKLHGF